MQGREEGEIRSRLREQLPNAKPLKVSVRRLSFVTTQAREVETVKNLYDSLVEAKTKCGEPTEDFSFPRFHRLIASKAERLKERLGCERVSFSVDVEGGHVSFKARAERD